MREPTRDSQGQPTGDSASVVARQGVRQRLKMWHAAVLAVVVSMGAVAAALNSVLDINDRVFGDDPPLTGRNAAFTKVDLVEDNAMRHAYCRDEFEGTTLQKCLAEPNSIGNIFSVGLSFKGYEGVCCSLHWTLENVTLKTVPTGFEDFIAVPDIEPRNPARDSRIFRIFVPNATLAGDYVVHFALEDRDGTIKEASSKVFSAR
jgi:hypothetical protein